MADRRPTFALAALVVVGALLGAASAARAGPNPENLLLRLPDFGPGYVMDDGDSGCGMTLSDESAPRSLERLERRHRQRNCSAQFGQAWVPPGQEPGPPLVESFAFRFRSPAGAEAGFDLRRDLIAYSLGLSRRSLTPGEATAQLGDAAAVYRTDDALVGGRPRRPGVVVAWRSGRVLSLVLEGGLSGAEGEQAANDLAARQQGRIESPTPLRPADNDDTEVPLDNPALGIAVPWLGRSFRPGGSLPRLVLDSSFGPLGRGESPGWRVELQYGVAHHLAPVVLGIWEPRAWARFKRTRLGRLVWSQRCARVRRVSVPGGRALIYAGQSKPHRRCGRRRSDRFLAHVYLDDVVVSVNIPGCFMCVEPDERSEPYNSRAGLRAVVRGLRPRVVQQRATGEAGGST